MSVILRDLKTPPVPYFVTLHLDTGKTNVLPRNTFKLFSLAPSALAHTLSLSIGGAHKKSLFARASFWRILKTRSVSALCETLNPDKTKLFHQNTLKVQKFSDFESLMNCTQKPVVHGSMLRKIQNARHDSATYEKLRWEGRRYFSNNCTQTSKAFRSRLRHSHSPRFEL